MYLMWSPRASARRIRLTNNLGASAPGRKARAIAPCALSVHDRGVQLHVVRIRRLDSLTLGYVLQDLPDLARCMKSDRFEPIELSLVPIHLCEAKNLLRQKTSSMFCTLNADRKGLRRIHSWICLEEINAPTRIQHVFIVRNRQQCPSQGWIRAISEKVRGTVSECQQFKQFNMEFVSRSLKPRDLLRTVARALVNYDSCRKIVVLRPVGIQRVDQDRLRICRVKMRLSVVLTDLGRAATNNRTFSPELRS